MGFFKTKAERRKVRADRVLRQTKDITEELQVSSAEARLSKLKSGLREVKGKSGARKSLKQLGSGLSIIGKGIVKASENASKNIASEKKGKSPLGKMRLF